MKCLVLAGGSGDRLWPLSRKDYPKQFMEIREGRSMFQDTVLRNIPFCDEFIILTNKAYKNIVRGQLDAFQSLDYTIITEDASHKTAFPVIACLLKCDADDEICITPSDCIIEGDYSATMSDLKDGVKDNKFVAIACKPTTFDKGYNYLTNGKTTVFGAKPVKGNLWDTGIWGAKAEVFLDSFNRDVVEKCKSINIKRNNTIDYSDLADVKPISLTKIVTNTKCSILSAKFNWYRIIDISSFYNYYNKAIANNDNTISNSNKGVEIVNMVGEQLIIANGLKNSVIVNTRDAIYVTSKTKEADIKSILEKYGNGNKRYFEYAPKKYESWGMEELIGNADNCNVRIIKIYEHETMPFKLNKNLITNFFVVEGNAGLSVDGDESEYSQHQSFTLTDNKKYHISNIGKSELILSCIEKQIRCKKVLQSNKDCLIKMKPVFKDNLWGGTKIRDVFGKDVGDFEIIAESWELSAHQDGESMVANGNLAGKKLSKYINYVGKERLGWKAQNYDKFPLMIKFIDAKSNLSIQVHPADDYARTVEGDYGKNEMWHIIDADDDAYIYIGFNKDVTKGEIRERIKDNTILNVLNKVYVKKGETYFLKAGTVHAIGAGCFICEIQQSSNVTYRLYDYNRKDKDGNLRELHIDKALDVLDLKAFEPKSMEQYEGIMHYDYVKKLIGQCKYFVVNKFFIDGECSLPAIESSFQAFVIIEGKGTISDGINTYSTKFGDTWLSMNKVSISLKGKLTALVVNI